MIIVEAIGVLIFCGSFFYAFGFLLCAVLNGLASRQRTKEFFNQKLIALKQEELKKQYPINEAIRLVIQPCSFYQLSKWDKQFIVEALFNERKLRDFPKLKEVIS